jgi:hypothetical protein
VPSGAFVATTHIGCPERQSMVFFTQGTFGSEQSAPGLHVLHAPLLQTDSAVVPQGVPSVT